VVADSPASTQTTQTYYPLHSIGSAPQSPYNGTNRKSAGDSVEVMTEFSTSILGTNNTEGGGISQGNHIAVREGSFAVYFGIISRKSCVRTQLTVAFLGESRTKDDEASRWVSALYLTDSIDDRDRIINTRGSRTEETCE
jgi:hypothetical protein